MVQPPKIGDIIKMYSWHGVVLDVFKNEKGRTILRVHTARNVFRKMGPEFIEFDLAPDKISLTTLADLEAEIAQHHQMLQGAIEGLMIEVKIKAL